MSFLRIALLTVPLIVLIGTISGRLAGSGEGNAWFEALQKPDFMPPGWVFGAAWTFLYVLLGLSLAFLIHARGARGRGAAITLFLLQMAANYAWSPLFFAAHQTGWALALIGLMIVLTLVLFVMAWRIRRVAALLLLPYLLWLGFAAALNHGIWTLNPGAVAPGASRTDIAL